MMSSIEIDNVWRKQLEAEVEISVWWPVPVHELTEDFVNR
jgi:hypothetical protein